MCVLVCFVVCVVCAGGTNEPTNEPNKAEHRLNRLARGAVVIGLFTEFVHQFFYFSAKKNSKMVFNQ